MRLGLHLDGVPQDGLAALDAAEQQLGPVEVVHWFQAWDGGHGPFRTDWLDAVAASGRHGLVTWEPWSLTGEAAQPAFAPEAIAAGAHDAYLAAWAAGFAARSDGPWYVRLMHEMNGNWYPWGGRQPGAGPDAYRAAWAHIHGLFRSAGVTNVAWVWSPLVDDVAGPFEAWYPGDGLVDVLGLSAYNWGAEVPENGGWRSPAQLLDGAYARLTTLGPQPVWLTELGCAPEAPPALIGATVADGGGAAGPKGAWLAGLVASAPERWPRLETIVFFSLSKERDWRVHHDPAIATAIRTARRLFTDGTAGDAPG